MNEIKEVLNDMEGVELDDLKTKYELSVKMLFALIESVEESVSEKQQSKISNMYNSLSSNLWTKQPRKKWANTPSDTTKNVGIGKGDIGAIAVCVVGGCGLGENYVV